MSLPPEPPPCLVCHKPGVIKCVACGERAVYCGFECQRQDWPVHREVCPNGIARHVAAAEAQLQQEEDKRDLKFYVAQTASIIYPVMSCIILSVLWVKVSQLSTDFRPQRSQLTVYTPQSGDSSGTIIAGGFSNALVILAEIVGATFLFVLLFKCGCFKVLYAYLFLVVVLLLGFMTYLLALNFIQVFAIPMDYVSFVFMLYNFAAGGVIAIFGGLVDINSSQVGAAEQQQQKVESAPWVPMYIQQAYLVVMSSLMAFSLTGLDAWTTWALLAVLAVWDLVAVLCPQGPLKMLLESSREQNRDIPALLYTNQMLYFMVNESEDIALGQVSPRAAAEPQIEVEEEQVSGLKLGLGDFVFYSVLVSRCTLTSDWTTTIACLIAVMTGLTMTIILLAVFKKALPALPISIAMGLLFYFVSNFTLSPYVAHLNLQGMMI